MDTSSTPDKGQLLYDNTHSKKELIWFEKGMHSHIRINAPEKYDQSIVDFLNTL